MVRPRPRTAAVAAACLIAGIVIGYVLPRRSHVAPPAHDRRAAPSSPAATGRIGREVYSPIIIADPYVRGKHAEIVDSLERQCRLTGKNCQLATSARQAMGRTE